MWRYTMNAPLIYALPYVFTIMFGMFDGAQTVRKDAPDQAIFWKHESSFYDFYNASRREEFRARVRNDSTVFTKRDLWYAGGNRWYPPHSHAYLWRWRPTEHKVPDFWHQQKQFWTYCIGAVAITAAWSVHEEGGFKPYHGCYLLLNGVEGLTFNFSYKYLWRKKKHREKNIWEYIKKHVISHPDYK